MSFRFFGSGTLTASICCYGVDEGLSELGQILPLYSTGLPKAEHNTAAPIADADDLKTDDGGQTWH